MFDTWGQYYQQHFYDECIEKLDHSKITKQSSFLIHLRNKERLVKQRPPRQLCSLSRLRPRMRGRDRSTTFSLDRSARGCQRQFRLRMATNRLKWQRRTSSSSCREEDCNGWRISGLPLLDTNIANPPKKQSESFH